MSNALQLSNAAKPSIEFLDIFAVIALAVLEKLKIELCELASFNRLARSFLANLYSVSAHLRALANARAC